MKIDPLYKLFIKALYCFRSEIVGQSYYDSVTDSIRFISYKGVMQLYFKYNTEVNIRLGNILINEEQYFIKVLNLFGSNK